MSKTLAEAPRFSLVNLGCPKNLVDSEGILGSLVGDGFILCEDPADAQVILVNTCGFIDAAREESLAVIREMAGYKAGGDCRALVVVGCMAQRFSGMLESACPDIDAIMGLSEYARLPGLCRDLAGGALNAADAGGALNAARARKVEVQPPTRSCRPDTGRLRITPRHYAYLKISEGCNHTCTFCVIPKIRGAYRSKSAEDCVTETLELISSGARELMLVAEDSTFWGREYHGRVALERLLEELERKAYGLEWIRILYAHPIHVTDRLVDAMAALPKVVPYVDMPIQHAADAVLHRMQRGYNQDRLRRVVEQFRDRLPGVVLRTTIITGFPGETDRDVDDLMKFLEDVRFERLGCFTYSPEEGTPAHAMEDEVPPEVRAERRDRIMELQQSIAFDYGRSLVGRTVSCIVDEVEDDVAVGRTYGDAPDIDGVIEIRGAELVPGDMLDVEVVDCRGYDLLGRVAGDPR